MNITFYNQNELTYNRIETTAQYLRRKTYNKDKMFGKDQASQAADINQKLPNFEQFSKNMSQKILTAQP